MEADHEEIAAGVEQISRYGFYGTLHRLALGNILNFEAILKKSVYEIYAFLQYESELNAYRERLQEIYQEKQRLQGKH